ncbi:MAG: flippase-like domain-containing protein [Lachnospiraceae bacterium]|nr:flippase-like domain-containing protein [Lachnospiraceae bacterium]
MKAKIFKILFFVIIFAITAYSVLKGKDLGSIWDAILGVKKRWIVLALLLTVMFICSESVIISYMLRVLKSPVKLWKCILVSWIGFFYCYITPSATGGQPMQMYYLKRENVDYSVSMPVIMVVTITYKLILVLIGIPLMIWGRPYVSEHVGSAAFWLYLGVFLNIICVGFMLLLLFRINWAGKILYLGLRFLKKIHLIRNYEAAEAKLVSFMKSYQDTANSIAGHWKMLGNVMVMTVFQRLFYFSISWCVYKSFGLSGTGFWTIIFLQALIATAVDMLPFPGGMGITEHMFEFVFAAVYPAALLTPANLLMRGVTFYSIVFIGAIVSVVSTFVFKRRDHRSQQGVST